VEDRGIGIPENDRERLFARYSRGSNVSGIVGTGVGLYLVKMVIDLHRGAVAVESREGEGSRFTVRLPEDLPLKNATPASLATAPVREREAESIESPATAK
jgi:signal transduction histidine kinase